MTEKEQLQNSLKSAQLLSDDLRLINNNKELILPIVGDVEHVIWQLKRLLIRFGNN
jgi:hypothetical protein